MKRVLHVGCGKRKAAGSVGLDLYPGSDADVLGDLNHFPYPFPDNTFDEIICEHVLEHLEDLVGVVEEIHRITRPGGKIIVEVPHFTSVYFYQDPTHRRPFTSKTFDYFVEGTEVSHFGYSRARLKVLKAEFPPPTNAGMLKRAIFRWINRHVDSYERRLGWVLPRHLLRFELMVVK
jgi:SAM-dependent methyltransferase